MLQFLTGPRNGSQGVLGAVPTLLQWSQEKWPVAAAGEDIYISFTINKSSDFGIEESL